MLSPSRKKQKHKTMPSKTASFFIQTPSQTNPTNITTKSALEGLHNLSSYNLTKHDVNLLIKGLSFAPTPNTPTHKLHIQTLSEFNEYAKSLRLKHLRMQYRKTPANYQCQTNPTQTSYLQRRMKFIHPPPCETPKARYSGVPQIEHYVETTKELLEDNLPSIHKDCTTNLPPPQRRALKALKQNRQTVTVKPADKNLGIVLMNTEDYITQCMLHLTDKSTYSLAPTYPSNAIKQQLQNRLIDFKSDIQPHKHLYKSLLNETRHKQTPQFYGIPKIHKQFTHLPPVRPIVAQTNSILSLSASFIDHVLQPLARSYPDYIQNSTVLSLQLQDLQVPDDSTLVTVDVTSLYPSIPQTECLDVIYNEMYKHPHLLTFNPNFIISLLHLNMNNNYFTFADFTFQQIQGTAMGAAFSPTVANIYMSTILDRFLKTQKTQPFLLRRYIDDIIMIWTDTTEKLLVFLQALNAFHPHLNFTHKHSQQMVDYLDLTIYKGTYFNFTNILDTKTYQKPLNLYQYLHYTSNHQPQIYKSIIKGETIRYIRTNTSYETYNATLQKFKQRLLKRGYPKQLIMKLTATVQYNKRQQYLLRHNTTQHNIVRPPLYKCLPPTNFQLLKQLTLQIYKNLRLPSPRFITLRHKPLRNMLVRAKLEPSDEQLVDIALQLDSGMPTPHVDAATLPQLKAPPTKITSCRHPRCLTCSIHLNCQPTFKSSRTNLVYQIRHSFSCTSSNLIYLITCKRCHKQYVGLTTKQLNVRVNHHRTKKQINISQHYNRSDHSISHLTIQPIDRPSSSTPTQQELQDLERYWIMTLKTKFPQGLNIQ